MEIGQPSGVAPASGRSFSASRRKILLPLRPIGWEGEGRGELGVPLRLFAATFPIMKGVTH